MPSLLLQDMHRNVLDWLNYVEKYPDASQSEAYQKMQALKRKYVAWAACIFINGAGPGWGEEAAANVRSPYLLMQKRCGSWRGMIQDKAVKGFDKLLGKFMDEVDRQLAAGRNDFVYGRIVDVGNNWHKLQQRLNAIGNPTSLHAGNEDITHLNELKMNLNAQQPASHDLLGAEATLFTALQATVQAFANSTLNSPQLVVDVTKQLHSFYTHALWQVERKLPPIELSSLSLGAGGSSAFDPSERRNQRAKVLNTL